MSSQIHFLQGSWLTFTSTTEIGLATSYLLSKIPLSIVLTALFKSEHLLKVQFWLQVRALAKGLILASVRLVEILERATFLIHGWIHTLNTGEIFWAGILNSHSSRKSLLML